MRKKMTRKQEKYFGKLYSEYTVCLPIPAANTTDVASGADPLWCVAIGVYPGADVVLRQLRDQVLPFVRFMETHDLEGFHFLVHDRNSGVPTSPDDHGKYIQLRLRFFRPKWQTWMESRLVEPFSKFIMLRPVTEEQTHIAGVDLRLIAGGKTDAARVRIANSLIDAQSALVLRFIEAHQWTDDAMMVRQMKQFWHLLANMTQIKVG